MLLRTLFWTSCLCLPASAVAGLFALNAVNPLAVAFLTEFRVSNRSNERVTITPIGAVGRDGLRRTLPLSISSHFSIPSPSDRAFVLDPGTERSFTYDWDDIQFSEILVLSESGEAREVVVDPNPTENQYYAVENPELVIPPLEHLPRAKAEVIAVHDTRSHKGLYWSIVLCGLLAPIGIVYAQRRLTSALAKVEQHPPRELPLRRPRNTGPSST